MNQTKSHFWSKRLSLHDFISFNKTQTFFLAVSYSFKDFVKGLITKSMLKKKSTTQNELSLMDALQSCSQECSSTVDLGGFIFNLLPWKEERSREEAWLKRLKTKEDCNATITQRDPHRLSETCCEKESAVREEQHTLLKYRS